jgi:hypothetical protein
MGRLADAVARPAHGIGPPTTRGQEDSSCGNPPRCFEAYSFRRVLRLSTNGRRHCRVGQAKAAT